MTFCCAETECVRPFYDCMKLQYILCVYTCFNVYSMSVTIFILSMFWPRCTATEKQRPCRFVVFFPETWGSCCTITSHNGFKDILVRVCPEFVGEDHVCHHFDFPQIFFIHGWGCSTTNELQNINKRLIRYDYLDVPAS